ncbi:MAG: hypothetical protein LBC92_04175 [Rickettsiales bacterium]|jgi:hypothetical protein|nr:hypothetical protein [Rickettsiales bacterium]
MVEVRSNKTISGLTLQKNGMPLQSNVTIPGALPVPNGYGDYSLYDSKTGDMCPISKGINHAIWLNIIFGGVIGLVIDAATGNIVNADDTTICYTDKEVKADEFNMDKVNVDELVELFKKCTNKEEFKKMNFREKSNCPEVLENTKKLVEKCSDKEELKKMSLEAKSKCLKFVKKIAELKS